MARKVIVTSGRDRASKRGLKLADIVDAAVFIADSEGLESVSMARIADAVGYTPMALYRHVPGKRELLELMVDTAVGPPPDTNRRSGDWRERLTAWSLALAAGYRRRQWIFDVPISGPPVLPNSLRWMEAGLAILRDTGLGPELQMALLSTFTSYLRGNEQLLGEITREQGRDEHDALSEPESYGRALARVIPDLGLPVLEGIVAEGVLDDFVGMDTAQEHEAELRFGLELIMDGVENLIERTGLGARS